MLALFLKERIHEYIHQEQNLAKTDLARPCRSFWATRKTRRPVWPGSAPMVSFIAADGPRNPASRLGRVGCLITWPVRFSIPIITRARRDVKGFLDPARLGYQAKINRLLYALAKPLRDPRRRRAVQLRYLDGYVLGKYDLSASARSAAIICPRSCGPSGLQLGAHVRAISGRLYGIVISGDPP